MGGVDLSDQIKVTYEVDRRGKFRFYFLVFFDILDIAVVNSKIVFNKIESAPSLSSLDFRYSIAQNFFILLSILEKLPLKTRGTSVSRNFPGNRQQI